VAGSCAAGSRSRRDELRLAEHRLDRRRRRLAEAADARVAHRPADVGQQDQLLLPAAGADPVREAGEQLLLPDRPDATRHTLAARLVAEERGDPTERADEIGGLVEDHDDARAERGPDRAGALECERRVEDVRPDEHTGRATEQDRPDRAAARHAPGELEQLAEGRPERDLVDPRSPDVPREAEQLVAGRAFGPDRCEPLAASGACLEDGEHVHECLDVVHGGRLAEQPEVDRIGRLVARFASLALDGFEEGGLLAADVGARTTADLDVEREVRAGDVLAEVAGGPGGVDRNLQPRLRQRVLTPDVEVAAGRVRGVALDRHGLDERERIVLHEHPILERARLGLVGVADDVVRALGARRDRGPLPARRECRAAAAHEPRVGDLPDRGLGAHRQRVLESLVAAIREVVVEGAWVDDPDPPQEHEPGIAHLRHGGERRLSLRSRLGRHHGRDGRRCSPGPRGGRSGLGGRTRRPGGRGTLEPGDHARRIDGRRKLPGRRLAGDREHRRRSELAHAEAGAPEPRRLPIGRGLTRRRERPPKICADVFRAREPAGDVVADMRHRRRSRPGREERIERRDAIGLGGWHGEPLADVVEARLADLADAILERMEHREEQVPPAPRVVAATGHVALGRRIAIATAPARCRGTEDRVDRGSLSRRCQRPDHVQIHRCRVYGELTGLESRWAGRTGSPENIATCRHLEGSDQGRKWPARWGRCAPSDLRPKCRSYGRRWLG